MLTTTAFQIDSPVIFGVLVILAVFSNLYPKYLQIHLESFLAIDEASWRHFPKYYDAYKGIYTQYHKLLSQQQHQQQQQPNSSDNHDNESNSDSSDDTSKGHDELSRADAILRLQHELQDQERMLFKYPQIFFDRYELNKTEKLRIPASVTKRATPYTKGRLPAAAAHSFTGFLPTLLVFLTWLTIVLFCGFNYSIYSIYDYSSTITKPIPQIMTEPGVFTMMWTWLVDLFYGVLMIVPNLVLRSASTFLGLYWILFQLIDCFLWLLL